MTPKEKTRKKEKVDMAGALLSANIRLEEDAAASGSVVIPSGAWIFEIIAQVETPFDDTDAKYDLGDTDNQTLWINGDSILNEIGSVPGDHNPVVYASQSEPDLGWKHYPNGTTITGSLVAAGTGAGVLNITVIYTVPSA